MTTPDFLPILSHGSHSSPEQGACVMEMVSFLAGEMFSDDPYCVNSIIRNEAVSVNDLVSDDNRSKIALLIPRFMNTEKLNGNADFLHEVCNAKWAFLASKEMSPDLRDSVAVSIKWHFNNDEGDKRRTNEEYDQIGIDWLNELLDIADKHLGRHAHIDLSEYVPQMKAHPSQVKVNA